VKEYSTRTLYNGVEIPGIGLGTYRMDDAAAARTVAEALAAGYRMIDTASMYGNEQGVGQGVSSSGIPREDVFLVSKVWNTDQGYQRTIGACEQSLKRLNTDYLDLYLIHWPKEQSFETWKAMEKLYRMGKLRAVGVSNFKIHHLQDLADRSDMLPMINQVELHPFYPQKRLRRFCEKLDVLVCSWAPLARGRITEIPQLNEIARSHGKTVSQIVLRWHCQLSAVPIPKTVHAERLRENLDIFDFSLSGEEMKIIASLKRDRIGPDPDLITF